ncbi:unnamed protein product [Parajaminaea phylloscopi]
MTLYLYRDESPVPRHTPRRVGRAFDLSEWHPFSVPATITPHPSRIPTASHTVLSTMLTSALVPVSLLCLLCCQVSALSCDSRNANNRFVVRRVKDLNNLPFNTGHDIISSQPVPEEEDEHARGLIDEVTSAIAGITGGAMKLVGEVLQAGRRMPLKYVPQETKPTISSTKFLTFYAVPTSDSSKTKYRLLPSHGEFRLEINVGGVVVAPILDSGSSDLILDKNVTRYHPNAATFSGKTFNEAYAGGESVSGNIHRETVRIGGIQLENQAVGKVNEGWLIPASLQPPPDGVLGMGFSGSSSFFLDYKTDDVLPFADRASQAGLLKKFAFDLRTDGGFVDFNDGVDATQARFAPITDQTMWMIKGTMNGVALGSGALIDSGTEAMFGPAEAVTNMLKATGAQLIKDSEGNIAAEVDCEKGIELRFNFGGEDIVVSGAQSAQTLDSGKCISSLVGQVESDGTFTIGQPLFYHSYIIFDTAQKAISIKSKPVQATGSAAAGGAGAPSTSSADGSDSTTTSDSATGGEGATTGQSASIGDSTTAADESTTTSDSTTGDESTTTGQSATISDSTTTGQSTTSTTTGQSTTVADSTTTGQSTSTADKTTTGQSTSVADSTTTGQSTSTADKTTTGQSTTVGDSTTGHDSNAAAGGISASASTTTGKVTDTGTGVETGTSILLLPGGGKSTATDSTTVGESSSTKDSNGSGTTTNSS